MKIDCPHCGVHGSVDDSLAGRKLRCPKCSKVFLVTEEILPEVDDNTLVDQEIPSEDELQDLESVEAVPDEPEEEILIEEPGDSLDETQHLDPCSVCNQFFAPEFLVEVESRRYCALCLPEVEEEGLEILEEVDVEAVPEEELLEIVDEDSSEAEAEGEEILTDEDELLDLMDDEQDDSEEDSDALALLDVEADADDLEEEDVELEKCSGCGELLHPDFLETVGSERLCALCVPEDEENVADLEEDETEESIVVQDEQALLSDEEDDKEEVEDDDDFSKESCSVCGEKFHRDFMQEIDSQLYCGVCQPEVIEELPHDDKEEGAANVVAAGAVAAAADERVTDTETDEEDSVEVPEFTVGELIKEAWQKTKGAKGSIWGGMIVMYAIVFAVSFGGTLAFQSFYKGTDPTVAMGANGALQVVSSWLSMVMTGGIMLIGVRRVLEQRVSWKMVFAGFAKALSITVALILQTVLVIIGFVLLILPGIYLAVGYALTLPLIIDKGMGPWEALEASRKAIHKKWWTVFGLYLVMLLLFTVAAIPLGLGLIWILPMFYVLIGVLYVRLFGFDGIVEEEMEDDIAGDDSEEDDTAEVEEAADEQEGEQEESSEELKEDK